MDVATLSPSQVKELCSIQESHFFDRKALAVSPAKLSRAMSAFANADGGELVVGINDDGTWAGASEIERFNGHLSAFEPLFPYGTEFNYEFLANTADGTFVLHITIQKSRDIKVATDGKTYIRRGAQCLECSDLDLLARQKGLTTRETATLKFDPVEIWNSETVIGFMLDVLPTTDPEKWLRKEALLVEGLPTVAATVLFHDEPQVHLPKSGVKLYRYASSGIEGEREHLAYDPVSIEGCAYQVIKLTVDETIRQVEEIPILEASGLSEIKYPRETLHEIITNAVIHRDYAINDDVHVRIFDNRIEVQSPGSLPANITPGNILDERFSRNPKIVRLLNKFPDPPNKDVGEGLNTAFAAMRKLDLREPLVEDTGTSVRVVIRHEPLAAPEQRIVDYLARSTTRTINNREARALLHRPDAERSIRKLFQKMSESGIIQRVPGTVRGGSRYQLIEHGDGEVQLQE